MGRVHRVFHWLNPVAIELRLNKNFSLAVLAIPDIEIRYDGRRLRAEISPVQSYEFLNWIRPLLDGQMKLTIAWFRRCFETVPFCVEKPTVIGAGNSPFFDAAIRKRSAAVRTGILQQSDVPLLVTK